MKDGRLIVNGSNRILLRSTLNAIGKMRKQMSTEKNEKPIRVLQFGEGNFLRCFFDWMVEQMNLHTDFNGSVQVIQPHAPQANATIRALNERKGRYHTVLRGIKDDKPIEEISEVHCVQGAFNAHTDRAEIEKTMLLPSLRFVVSNTTEAGIVHKPNTDTFPAKLAKLLKIRYEAKLPGLIFLPCELIEKNGEELRSCILKYVEDEDLKKWITTENLFCDTLVDRIVAGRPDPVAAERYDKLLGEHDPILVCGEPFHLWVIQAPSSLEKELPLQQAGLNVIYTNDLTPYRTMKVRFLNGAHTSTVLAGHLAGFTFVDELVRDPRFNALFHQLLFDEIFPTLDLPDEEKRKYAESVLTRFSNPFAHHRLLSIALNSVSKWKVRVLPTLLDYQKKFNRLPEGLTQSLAALIRFYQTDAARDAPKVISFMKETTEVEKILGNTEFWGMDLNTIPGFTEKIKGAL